jgi:hypothetical protein
LPVKPQASGNGRPCAQSAARLEVAGQKMWS